MHLRMLEMQEKTSGNEREYQRKQRNSLQWLTTTGFDYELHAFLHLLRGE